MFGRKAKHAIHVNLDNLLKADSVGDARNCIGNLIKDCKTLSSDDQKVQGQSISTAVMLKSVLLAEDGQNPGSLLSLLLSEKEILLGTERGAYDALKATTFSCLRSLVSRPETDATAITTLLETLNHFYGGELPHSVQNNNVMELAERYPHHACALLTPLTLVKNIGIIKCDNRPRFVRVALSAASKMDSLDDATALLKLAQPFAPQEKLTPAVLDVAERFYATEGQAIPDLLAMAAPQGAELSPSESTRVTNVALNNARENPNNTEKLLPYVKAYGDEADYLNVVYLNSYIGLYPSVYTEAAEVVAVSSHENVAAGIVKEALKSVQNNMTKTKGATEILKAVETMTGLPINFGIQTPDFMISPPDDNGNRLYITVSKVAGLDAYTGNPAAVFAEMAQNRETTFSEYTSLPHAFSEIALKRAPENKRIQALAKAVLG